MYIVDRGYAQFALWNVIVSKNSSYCCRIRDNSAHDVVQPRELTDSDIAAGVVSDEVVSFDAGAKARIIPDHPVRIVTVKATPHRSGGKTGGGRTGPNCDGFLRIATNRLDLPAELVSELYRLRWVIENFFRMFKQLLGCRHLLSTKTNGVEVQVYCGIIACLLIMLYTGRQPTKRTFEMVCFFLSGWASQEELERLSSHSRSLRDCSARSRVPRRSLLRGCRRPPCFRHPCPAFPGASPTERARASPSPRNLESAASTARAEPECSRPQFSPDPR
jgi:hypothetical protein